eukprot:CAMPEP_0174284218 /NCGR_PEP_ID=MMETSP0809-20121228/4966_1 /TAXON_ID=73025 ORGANISM="Eutreptiella gymnastica-like, Strain CCMP1594" /NCGR_SAMPLE_ID=MMETSP0809 /ASSEMBLY_ACC=CAM_ASM_000658 /LENGTH=33 /DNA_ID= /DNA_START= /DNA_END= /DNA_ORIENTATION=
MQSAGPLSGLPTSDAREAVQPLGCVMCYDRWAT